MVGAVLVYEDRIIGEGYHREYGKAHAEVNCIQSVAELDRPLISSSTLYVNLEPCSHHGTPPCSDLILEYGIKVVIASLDPNPLVAGNGVKKLQDAGVEVVPGYLPKKAII
jgi:diaminohydroxyphosphoribosylaminopyrimidine deaminase/5-amino-6-(5-phosphoribosylamino)uracil reductase